MSDNLNGENSIDKCHKCNQKWQVGMKWYYLDEHPLMPIQKWFKLYGIYAKCSNCQIEIRLKWVSIKIQILSFFISCFIIFLSSLILIPIIDSILIYTILVIVLLTISFLIPYLFIHSLLMKTDYVKKTINKLASGKPSFRFSHYQEVYQLDSDK